MSSKILHSLFFAVAVVLFTQIVHALPGQKFILYHYLSNKEIAFPISYPYACEAEGSKLIWTLTPKQVREINSIHNVDLVEDSISVMAKLSEDPAAGIEEVFLTFEDEKPSKQNGKKELVFSFDSQYKLYSANE